MKSIYAAPAATTRGDVVHSTLIGKALAQGEPTGNPSRRVTGGSALSFGL